MAKKSLLHILFCVAILGVSPLEVFGQVSSTAHTPNTHTIAPQNNTLYFPGSQSTYVEVPSPKNMPGTEITLESWVYIENYVDWASIVDREHGDESWQMGLILTKRLSFTVNHGGPQGLPECELPLKQWIHVAVSFRDKKADYYINGVHKGSIAFVQSIGTEGHLIIGGNPPGGWEAWHGMIDELRVWNKALTSEEILSRMNSPLTGKESGLVAYYNFDEGTGDILHDLSPNGNHGKIYGAKWVKSGAPIRYGSPELPKPKKPLDQTPLTWNLSPAKGGAAITLGTLARQGQKPLIAYLCTPDTPKLAEAFADLVSLRSQFAIAVLVPKDTPIANASDPFPGMKLGDTPLYIVDIPPIETMILPRLLVTDDKGSLVLDSRGVGQGVAKTMEAILLGKTQTADLGGGVKMDLVWVPAGSFQMGGPEWEQGRRTDEGPVHTVELEGFWMGKTEVMVGQFRRFVEAASYQTDAEKKGKSCAVASSGVSSGVWEEQSGLNWRNPGFPQEDSHPVVHVSLNDAKAFCDWLSRKEGKEVRLPTEAEWEYACRAGSTTRFCFGDSDSGLGDYAWYKGNSGRQTHPVGQKKPNAWGLYDMHGNVWEWCGDRYDADYYGKSPSRNPFNNSSATCLVVRGGARDCDPPGCRSAFRGWCNPAGTSNNSGFRVVVSVRTQ